MQGMPRFECNNFQVKIICIENEDDFEDYDEYEKAYDNYRIATGEIKENLMFQTHYAMNLFDNKQVREKTLSETKRAKDIS